VVLHYGKELSVDLVQGIRSVVMQDADFNPEFNVIEDVTEVVDVKLDFQEMSQIAGKSVIKKKTRRAFVAKTDLQYGLARSYQTLSEAEGQEFMVFRDFDAAMIWVCSAEKKN